MAIRIGGQGIGLDLPQQLYPSGATNFGASYEGATNYLTLNTGDAQIIPPGTWWITHDGYSVLQWKDPVTGIWRGFSSARIGFQRVQSDGANFRVANLTSCPIAAVVTTQGSSYVQATTTVTASVGNSTWYPIIGGAISTSVTVATAGTGYTIPPLVYFPAPASPGVPATGYATLSGSTVGSIVVTNQGAGYLTAPVPVIIPSPLEPAPGSITAATATTTISGNAGKLCAILCTNSGAAVATMPTLTITGAGSSAAATAVVMYTIASATGSGGATYTSGENIATTTGGVTSATPVLTNPAIELNTFYPRPAVGVPTITANAVAGFTFTDTGLFTSSDLTSNLPTLLVLGQTHSTNPTGTLTNTPTLGGTRSTVIIQPI